jgi:hypothetical protein
MAVHAGTWKKKPGICAGLPITSYDCLVENMGDDVITATQQHGRTPYPENRNE